MKRLDRRTFIGTAVGAAGLVGAGALIGGARGSRPEPLPSVRDDAVRSPTDRVSLGASGLTVSVVGLGTGTIGWNKRSRQTRLGQAAFTRLMRHALDSGITLFDLADQYGSHPFFRTAMKGVPRDRYVVQTKTNSLDAESARADVDRFLSELGTDYIDSLLIHARTEADWSTRYRGAMDVLQEARLRGKVRALGVTCHSLAALRAAHASDWVQINQVRWNPRSTHMDAEVATVQTLFAAMRRKGQGMIGMKVVGQGDIVVGDDPLPPNDCFRFQIESAVVDAFVVGAESVDHVDQLLRGTQLAIAEVGYRRLATA